MPRVCDNESITHDRDLKRKKNQLCWENWIRRKWDVHFSPSTHVLSPCSPIHMWLVLKQSDLVFQIHRPEIAVKNTGGIRLGTGQDAGNIGRTVFCLANGMLFFMFWHDAMKSSSARVHAGCYWQIPQIPLCRPMKTVVCLVLETCDAESTMW